MSLGLEGLRGLFLSTGVAREPALVGAGGWRFHLALGRTVGPAPSSGPAASAEASQPAERGRGAARGQASPAGAGGSRGSRPALQRTGAHPGPPRSLAGAQRARRDLAQWRAACPGRPGDLPLVEHAEPGSPRCRPVFLVPRGLPWDLERRGASVPVEDPEPGRPVPGDPGALGPRRRAAILAHVRSLAGSLGCALDLHLDPGCAKRLHPDGRIEPLTLVGRSRHGV